MLCVATVAISSVDSSSNQQQSCSVQSAAVHTTSSYNAGFDTSRHCAGWNGWMYALSDSQPTILFCHTSISHSIIDAHSSYAGTDGHTAWAFRFPFPFLHTSIATSYALAHDDLRPVITPSADQYSCSLLYQKLDQSRSSCHSTPSSCFKSMIHRLTPDLAPLTAWRRPVTSPGQGTKQVTNFGQPDSNTQQSCRRWMIETNR